MSTFVLPDLDYKETTAPTVEPVTFAEMQTHTRIDVNDEQAIVDSMIVAARQWCETFMRRSLITRTYTGVRDCFPGNRIGLPMPPAISVTSVKYYDTGGTQQTLSTDVYDLDTASNGQATIFLKYQQSWPSTRGIDNAVEIIWTAGHGATAASVPDAAKQAIRLLVDHWHMNRGAVLVGTVSKDLERALNSLLWSLRTDL